MEIGRTGRLQKLSQSQQQMLGVLLWDDGIVEQSVPPLFNFTQSETTAELDPQMNRS